MYVKNIIDFILLNLVTIKYEEQAEYELKLLNFLGDILKRIQICHAGDLDINRIFEVISLAMNDNINKTLAVLSILESIAKFSITLPNNSASLVEKTLVSLFTQNNVRGICLLAKFVLGRLSEIDSNIVRKILEWTLIKSSNHICEDLNTNTTDEILSLILNLNSKNATELEKYYPNFSIEEKTLWHKLMQVSDKLWYQLMKDHSASELTLEILSQILVQFLIEEEMMAPENILVTLAELKEFFMMTTGAGYILEKFFFYFCHMQLQHSSLVWEPQLIIRCMAELFYEKNSKLEVPLLKSFFYLFPCLATSLKPKYVAYSYDYLKCMDLQQGNPRIFSFCQEQLIWILSMGSKSLKMEVLRYWLNNNSFHAVLVRVIIQGKFERDLLDLLIEDSEDAHKKIAVKFLQKLRSEEISKELAENLPLYIKKPNIFNYLLLSRPGLPDNDEKKMLLLELMVVALPVLRDNDVFKAACTYTNQLVKNLQNRQECLYKFTKYITTLPFLLNSLSDVPSDVCDKIFCLLKTLVSVQVKHQYQIDEEVEIDLASFIGRSDLSHRAKEYLPIIPIILKAKTKPMLKLKEESNLKLWYSIMELTEEPDIQDLGFFCLQLMMIKYEMLAFAPSVSNFIAKWCYLKPCHSKSHSLSNFIIEWMKILARKPKEMRPAIPSTEIESFVMRSGNLGKIKYFSKLLELVH
ncbi:hypothetical protein WA026_008279 [Henosepilachna vigintioctopunctata]